MKRTREEYDNAIAILQVLGKPIALFTPAQDNTYTYIDPATLESALNAMRELRDSAFALEEALVNLKPKAQAMLDRYEGLINSGAAGFWNPYEEEVVIELMMAIQVAKIAQAASAPGTAQEGVAAPAPAAPLQPHQSEEIMDNGKPEKFTGPSGGLPDAGNSTPGV